MYQYPYGDSQQLNLDWLVSQWQIVKDGIDQSLQAEIDRVENAISDLLNARDQAVAAAASANSDAGDAHNDAAAAHADALAAAGDAADANADALKAEGNAVGEQNGAPVSSGSPYYQNNAKYYANAAATSETNAGTSETNAGNSATAAGNAQAAAETAALKSEGFAVGEQNGVAVTSGSPYYQNNAEYYAQEAYNSVANVDTIKKQYPTIWSPLSELYFGDTEYYKHEGNIFTVNQRVAARNYFNKNTATPTFNANLCTIYLPAGTYHAEFELLEAETYPATLTNVYMFDFCVNDITQTLYRMAVQKTGEVNIKEKFSSGNVTLPAGYYVFSVLSSTDMYDAMGKITFSAKIVKS